jgi:hypothetical protein
MSQRNADESIVSSALDLCSLYGDVDFLFRSRNADCGPLQDYLRSYLRSIGRCDMFDADRDAAIDLLQQMKGHLQRGISIKAFYCLAPIAAQPRQVAQRLSLRDVPPVEQQGDSPPARWHFSMTMFSGRFFSEQTLDDVFEQADHCEGSDLLPEQQSLQAHFDCEQDEREAAFAILESLEFCNLEIRRDDSCWPDQNVYRIPQDKLSDLIPKISAVVAAAARCFSREKCVLTLQQPCYVFSDIHGD